VLAEVFVNVQDTRIKALVDPFVSGPCFFIFDLRQPRCPSCLGPFMPALNHERILLE
jgi:hypothetical protein